MARSEQQFIDLCKKQIEQNFAFGNGHAYTQRDLELLSVHIEEKTGTLISLSTLKRLWKDDYKQSPQLATLNALALVLDHKDWQSFKQANLKKPDSTKFVFKWLGAAAVLFVIIWLSVFGFPSASTDASKGKKSARPAKITGPIFFKASKTIDSGIPNTVIFKYNLSNVVADSFFIQQSWNRDHRMRIDPKDSTVTRIYYESGYHRAKLIVNDSIVALQPIHIISNGWEPNIHRSDSDPELVDLKNEKFISNGQLHLDSSMLARRNLDFSQKFHTRISNSQVFNLHSDNFRFSTRMKADRIIDLNCPWMDLIIVTDVQTFMVSMVKKGCERYTAYKLGEIVKSGENNDLSALGCDIYNWQQVEVKVKDRNATIYINGKPVYNEIYKQDYGKIVALIYIFGGTGSIDNARLEDGDGKVVFEDDFER